MLDLHDVSHLYANGTRALDGAGKSTLMRTIAKLQAPSEGAIRFRDIDVIAEPERLRRTLGYLPQDFGVYPRVSAYDMLNHMAVLKGISRAAERRETVETLLHQVNLWPVRKKALAGFSGGMRQRFGPILRSTGIGKANHELAHQYWGHQVLGARMQGASLLHETLAQYSALMVMKRLRGEEGVRQLLRFQRDRYLSGRRTQVMDEEPLVSVEISQQHIAYGKGALAMYLLQQRMGEAAVNRALRRFVERYRFTTAPYPRSLDLIAYLRQEAGTPANQTLITDLFERVTLHDLRVDRPTATRRPDGRWDVIVPIEARKAYADGKGAERAAALAEPIEIGLFTADPAGGALGRGQVIRMELRPIRSGRQVLRFVTDRRPSHAGIDPYGLFLDRNAGDNIGSVGG